MNLLCTTHATATQVSSSIGLINNELKNESELDAYKGINELQCPTPGFHCQAKKETEAVIINCSEYFTKYYHAIKVLVAYTHVEFPRISNKF